MVSIVRKSGCEGAGICPYEKNMCNFVACYEKDTLPIRQITTVRRISPTTIREILLAFREKQFGSLAKRINFAIRKNDKAVTKAN